MTQRRILCVGGIPGTGKTTLMREFMGQDQYVPKEVAKLVNCMIHKDTFLHIIGKYEDPNEIYAGTDKLSMAAAPEVIKFIQNAPNLDILFEGDRLFGVGFIEKLFELQNTEVGVFILETDPKIIQERYKQRGSEQNETWLNGRKTKVANVRKQFESLNKVKIFQHNTPKDTITISKAMSDYFDRKFEFEKMSNSLSDFF